MGHALLDLWDSNGESYLYAVENPVVWCLRGQGVSRTELYRDVEDMSYLVSDWLLRHGNPQVATSTGSRVRASIMVVILEIFKRFGLVRFCRTGVRRFEQVVLRRDLERWVRKGGKVELAEASKCAVTMYPAHPVSDFEQMMGKVGFPNAAHNL